MLMFGCSALATVGRKVRPYLPSGRWPKVEFIGAAERTDEGVVFHVNLGVVASAGDFISDTKKRALNVQALVGRVVCGLVDLELADKAGSMEGRTAYANLVSVDRDIIHFQPFNQRGFLQIPA